MSVIPTHTASQGLAPQQVQSVQLTGDPGPIATNFSSTGLNSIPTSNLSPAAQPTVQSPVSPEQISAPQDPNAYIKVATETYIKSLEALDPYTAAVAATADNPFTSIIQNLQTFFGESKTNAKDQSNELNAAVQNLEQLKEALGQNMLTNLQSSGFANYAAGANNSNMPDLNPIVAALIKSYNSTENKTNQAAIIQTAIQNYLNDAIDLDHQAAHMQVQYEIDARDPNSLISNCKTIIEHVGPVIGSVIEGEQQKTQKLMLERIAELPAILKRFGQSLINAADKILSNKANAQAAPVQAAPVPPQA